mmetsp:Transcript_109086/g.315164  ORF Transcript_109086/g.315164 Transcript_109086/m.315164 type:complete len:149 (-) Transcript_109086:176-622(-)
MRFARWLWPGAPCVAHMAGGAWAAGGRASIGGGLRLAFGAASPPDTPMMDATAFSPIRAPRRPAIVENTGESAAASLIQRRQRHRPAQEAALLEGKTGEPIDVEDMDLIWGVPKIVWVIMADIVAFFLFVTATWTVTNLAKKRLDDGG